MKSEDSKRNEKQYKELKTKDLGPLRQKLYEEQEGVCPILKQHLPVEQFVVDHQHRKNQQQAIGDNGAGLVRGCIQRHANALEGKIVNNWRRYGMSSFGISLPDFLRNLADYLERENLPLVHPTETPKPLIIKKSCYNKLVKAASEEKRIPEYRVSPKGKRMQKLTKPLAALFEKYKIEVEYY